MSKRIFPWLLVVLWMALIFSQSHKPAPESNKLSRGVTEKIVEAVEKVNPDVDINIRSFNNIIRKYAHFFSYLVLGVLVAAGFRSRGVYGYELVGFTMLLCVGYAITDEVHQLFLPGRGGQVRDVLIDSVGALVGVLGYVGVVWRR